MDWVVLLPVERQAWKVNLISKTLSEGFGLLWQIRKDSELER